MRRCRLGLALTLGLLPSLAGAERVVTLGPHLAELVCAAGACEQLVAVVAYSDFPASVRRLPVIGDANLVNAEALLALRPSLVLAWQGGTPPLTIDRLRAIGLRVEPVGIERLGDVAEALEQIGAWLGTAASAHRAAEDYRQRLASLARRYEQARRLRVFYQIETTPPYTVNGRSPISQAIQLCGGDNVFAALPTLAAPVSDEAVLAAAPEAVIHSQHDRAAILAYWARFPSAPAQAQRQIYGIDGDLLARAGPRLVDGAEQLCAVLDRARGGQNTERRKP